MKASNRDQMTSAHAAKSGARRTPKLDAAYARIEKLDKARSRIKQFPPQFRAKLATGEHD